MNKISDVEIFSEGEWNGHNITSNDLASMVDSFNKTHKTIRPFLKLGHDDEQKLVQNDGLPAAGWIDNLRHQGSKLVADFIDVPNKVKELIDKKAYRSVSSEVFSDIKVGEHNFPKMLGAVALLGADTPAVMNLSDILAQYSKQHGNDTVNFANNPKLFTILSEQNFSEETTMPEIIDPNVEASNKELEQLRAKNKELEGKLSESSDKFSSLEKSVEELQASSKLAAKELMESKAREAEANVNQFISNLKQEKLIAPAMDPYIKELLSDKAEFSVDDKKFDKFGIVKELLNLSKEMGKLNFSESTRDIDPVSNDEETKIEKFAKDNGLDLKADYVGVYRQYSKSVRKEA